MLDHQLDIINSIPHREPFLFVDKILNQTKETILTEKLLTGKEDFFRGHFPKSPIMPGVLLCETIFQSGALLMKKISSDWTDHKIGVVVKIKDTTFKHLVQPGDKLFTEVTLLEMLQNAYYMKGIIRVREKIACKTHFTCALIDKPEKQIHQQ